MISTRVIYCPFEQGFFYLSQINEERDSKDQVAYQFLTFTSQFKIALYDQQFAKHGKEKVKVDSTTLRSTLEKEEKKKQILKLVF